MVSLRPGGAGRFFRPHHPTGYGECVVGGGIARKMASWRLGAACTGRIAGNTSPGKIFQGDRVHFSLQTF
jgi:hypothetical protein